MPGIVRKGDMCSGHDCFPPRPCSDGSGNVFVNGRPAHMVGGSWEVHECTHPETPHGAHGGSLASGSATVFVNGKPVARIGDPVDCGSSCAQGSGNVFAGG